MAKRKVNIEIYSEGLPLEMAVDLVAQVISKGRISRDSFCYATVFNLPPKKIVVEAKANKLEQSAYISSDSFKVYYNAPEAKEQP